MEAPAYAIAQFCEKLGGNLLQMAAPHAKLNYLLTDSRLYQGQENAVFFAIRSGRNDGHRYMESLYAQGLRNFVLSDVAYAKNMPEANLIRVSDTVVALQQLAAAHRSNFQIPVIGITGSNGKTVVKEWLFQLLQRHKRVLRSPRSYNSQIGVPLSVWLLNSRHEIAIFEAGISEPNEMTKLEKVIQPTVGILTNIGEAHQEHFESLAQKLREKLLLFKNAQWLVYCTDQPLVKYEVAKMTAENGPELLDWGSTPEASLCIGPPKFSEKGALLNAIYRTGHGTARHLSIHIPFKDPAGIENACHCWRYLLHLGVGDEEIASGMAQMSPIAMRLQQLDAVHGSTLINDVYNSDLNSLEIALDQLCLQRKHQHYTAILSDLVQSAEAPHDLYAKVADMLRLRHIDRFVGIGPNLLAQQAQFKGIVSTFYADTGSFLAQFRHADYANQNILVKGARQFTFERIIDILSEKTHETILEIDLERVRDNLNYIRSLLKPETGIMVMVKAFGYGSGAYEIARTLEYHGAAYLAVAYADEGITLREAGIRMPILVLNPETGSYDAMIRYQLEPQLYSFRTLERFEQALFAQESALPYPVHLKINTGMNRLGFDLEEVPELAKRLSANEAMRVATVFTHLAASESPAYDGHTTLQLNRFAEAYETLKAMLPYGFKAHALNSEGIFRHRAAQYDMVRLGLALYGISNSTAFRKHLKPVSQLFTTISQIREVKAGEGVGYSPKKLLDRDTRIAVLPIGYADGLPRALGNGIGKVLIGNKLHPIVGNVCMDMVMVDVGDAKCEEGDRVEVFGDNLGIYEMATQLNTIPYEVLTGISQRVKRVYLHQ